MELEIAVVVGEFVDDLFVVVVVVVVNSEVVVVVVAVIAVIVSVVNSTKLFTCQLSLYFSTSVFI